MQEPPRKCKFCLRQPRLAIRGPCVWAICPAGGWATGLLRFGVPLASIPREMRIPTHLRMVLLILASTAGLRGQVDARQIIRHAVAADERNWSTSRSYEFQQRVELRRLDSRGGLTSSEVKTYDVSLQDGTPYRQLVKRDDRPLPATEEMKEQQSRAKSIAERRQETSAERAKRLSANSVSPDWQREAWLELADAFEFTQAGDGSLGGRRVFIIEAIPRQGYQPRSRTARLFRSLKAKFWVDQQNYQIVKVEAEVIDAVWMGLFLVRIAKGSCATLDLTRVSDGVWLPGRLQVFASARLGLLKTLRFEQEIRYSGYTSVPATARTVDLVEGREAHSARLTRSAKVIEP